MEKISGEVFNEPAKQIPVYGSCDVLVIGGGPGGTAAAIGSASAGADTVLVERYGHLGGLALPVGTSAGLIGCLIGMAILLLEEWENSLWTSAT